MKKINFLLVFLSFLSLIFLQTDFVKAQNASEVGIKISPVRVEELVEPGQVLQREIKVTNSSDIPKTLFAYLKDFRANEDDESGTPRLIKPGTETGNFVASWIEITDQGMDFKPGEEKTVSFVIRVPDNVGPGGYYGGVFFGSEAPKIDVNSPDKGAGMSIAQQAGSLVLLQVKGEVDERADVREFNTNKDFYGTPFDVEFAIRIQNSGNIHIKPLGEIRIENMFGKEVKIIDVNNGGGNVLPNSKRKFTEHWKDDFGFGKYTAKLGLSYGTSASNGGQGKQSIYIEKDFWIIPWKIVGPVLISLIITLLIFFFIIKFYKDRAVRGAMQRAGVTNAKISKARRGTSPTAHMGMVLLVVFIVVFLIVSAVYFFFLA
ncbi:DUF916 domain-containing protein [Candidatus Parcubacteria bacterium]|nr:DUF916 domain-containing protein [Patescibacteria group bacterium]MBU4309419.1 DUF916 domain-containing protein [Patescibacteria group bacterium]MBU4432656.1 DUF916 domain-containing protein [Patescibacteria group bacterium]MBU4577780.1 DUF916 domain-containing protein [Patescibacteria group bacterium]MCG2697465.1 DUF916 domain-containing protein [Candidatus Parcubacteria bacterium]